MNSSAQPTASAHSSSRMKPEHRRCCSASQKTKPCQTSPSRTTSTRPATTPSQIRSAIRPTSRRPATSCAEPGSTRVITSSVRARRNRTRDAAVARRSGWAGAPPGVETGGMGGPFVCRVRRFSITSHSCHSRHGAPDPDKPALIGVPRRVQGRGDGVRHREHGSVCAMPDRPSHDPDGGEGPDYDWLYGTRHQSTDRPPRRPLEDPEPTSGCRPSTAHRQVVPLPGPAAVPAPAGPPTGGVAGGPGTSPSPRLRLRRPGPHDGGQRPRLRWVLLLLVAVARVPGRRPLFAWQQDRQGRRDSRRASARPRSPGRRTCSSAATAARG